MKTDRKKSQSSLPGPSGSKAVGLLLATLLAPSSLAVPFGPSLVPLENVDGTMVQGRLLGDEHFSWAEDAEGYPLAYDARDGAWHYASVDTAGLLTPLPHRAGRVDPGTLGLRKHEIPTRPGRDRALAEASQGPLFGSPPRPLGILKNLVIFVKFNCAAGCAAVNRQTTFQPADFESVYNGASNSVKAYYREVSGNKLSVESTLASSAWIQLANNDAYYVRNPVTHGPTEMLREAVAYLDSTGFDFAPFDGNGDGAVDAIDVVHVGPGYETSGDMRCLSSQFLPMDWRGREFRTRQGLRLTAFYTTPEIVAPGRIITIGFPTHELGHVLGLPDLYDYTGSSAGLGAWSLMGVGNWGGPAFDGTSPVHLDAWSKYKLGFVAAEEIETTTRGIELEPALSAGKILLLKAGMPGSQYFLLETRARVGFDQYLPGTGLAIYHVDESRLASPAVGPAACGTPSAPTCNQNDKNHYLVDLEQADGRRSLNTDAREAGDATDLFPTATAREFTPHTTPNSIPYAQTASRISVQNIGRKGNAITLDVGIELLPQGASCRSGSQCESTFCADGVCCSTACAGGICDACSAAQGASADGVCSPLAGSCNDGDACTRGDVCAQGACSGAAVQCQTASPCQAAICDSATGSCVSTPVSDGTPCQNPDVCIEVGFCQQGVCGGTPRVCMPKDGVAGSCDSSSGVCTYPVSEPHRASGCGCGAEDGFLQPLMPVVFLWLWAVRRRPSGRTFGREA